MKDNSEKSTILSKKNCSLMSKLLSFLIDTLSSDIFHTNRKASPIFLLAVP